MSKHTPGPWKVRKGFIPDTFEIFHPDRSIKPPFTAGDLARVEGDFGPRGQGKANARLIASAPDLLQAAEQFLASVKDGNVSELVEYYADIFGDAVKKAGGHLPE